MPKVFEAPPGFVLNPDYLVPELRAQRDALLEALKVVIDDLMYQDHARVIDVARAAIKQAEGELK